jgi:hypothetical protein
MLKSKKFSMLIATIFILTVIFTQGVMAIDQSPFTKTNTLNQVESKTSIKLSLSGTNLSPQEKEVMNQIAPVLSNLEYDLTSKSIKDNEKNTTQAYVNMNMLMSGISANIEEWVKADITNDKRNFSIIMKLPSILPIAPGKDYLVLDTTQLGELTSSVKTPNLDMGKITELSKKFSDAFDTLALGLKTDFYQTTDMNEVSVTTPGGVSVAHGYELKIDDAGFKSILKYAIANLSQNKDILDALKAYLAIVDPTITSDVFDKEIIGAVGGVNTAFDNFKDIKIIGDKGFVFDYAVNAEGYIVHEKGTVDLSFDLPKLVAAISKMTDPSNIPEMDPVTGIYNLGITFDTVNYNLNDKNMKIDFPVLTPQNSTTFSALMKEQADAAAKLQAQMQEQAKAKKLADDKAKAKALADAKAKAKALADAKAKAKALADAKAKAKKLADAKAKAKALADAKARAKKIAEARARIIKRSK